MINFHPDNALLAALCRRYVATQYADVGRGDPCGILPDLCPSCQNIGASARGKCVELPDQMCLRKNTCSTICCRIFWNNQSITAGAGRRA